MDDLIDKVHEFIVANVGSSVCLCSSDESLLRWVCSQVVEKITKEYLILNEPAIEDIRYMTDFLYSASSDGYKLVFIHRAERILQEAANSMLKILEEPPLHCVIVLTTTRFADLLPTIRSRVKMMNIFVHKNVFESIKEKFANSSKADLILKLCINDFDVLDYVKGIKQFPSSVDFEVSEFITIFSEKELSASNKLKAAFMLDDLYAKFSTFSERDMVQLYLNIIKESNKIDLNTMVIFMCKTYQMIFELRGCREISTFKWLDSILANRLVNFNGSLTLLNLLILIRKSAKR